MANYAIISDVSSDLTKALRERFDIDDYVGGLIYFPDGHAELSDIDWERHTPKEFYESMRNKNVMYKTAAVQIGDIIEVFERHLSAGKDILALTLSSGLSGTYQVFEMAKSKIISKYPDRKIICIDSLRYSTALAMLVIEAALKRSEGLTLEECAEYINERKHSLHQIGPMDDLFFLCKTGRISNFKAFFGTLIGVNPMADFNRHGLAEVLGKFKGKKAAFDGVISYMKETVIDPQNQIMFVAHSNRLAAAEALRDMIIKEFSPKEVIINDVGMSCGASVGPGLCAAFYWGKEISEDMAYEKAVMQNILNNQNRKV